MSYLPAEEVTPAGFQEVADGTPSDGESDGAGGGCPPMAAVRQSIACYRSSVQTSPLHHHNQRIRQLDGHFSD